MSQERSFYIDPVPVCTELYGYQNVNSVRSCVCDAIYRLYGPFCDFHQVGLQKMVACYLVRILEQAGKNPKAVKLAIPPSHLQPRFFFEMYMKSMDEKKAYQYCLEQCNGNEDCMKNCYVDLKSLRK